MTKTRKQLLTQTSRKYPLEFDECLELTDWLRDHAIVYVHIPNEGLRSEITGRRLRAIGLHSGFPDYLVFRTDAVGTALEMKRVKGSAKPFNEQLQWRDRMLALGWDHIFGYGASDAIGKLKGLGYGR